MAPRLAKGPRKAPPISAPPRDAKPGDNAKAILEAEAAQLLSYLAGLREKKGVVDKAAAAVKTAREEMNEVFRLAKAASPNFTRQRLTELMSDMGSPQLRKTIQKEESIRARFRRVCGLPVGDEGSQSDLEDRMPETAQDQMHFRALGYTAGLAGENGSAPSFVQPQFLPDWSQGWNDGQAILITATLTAKDIPPPAPRSAKPTPTPAPEKTIAEEAFDEKKAIRAAKASLEALSESPLGKAQAALQALASDSEATHEQIAAAEEEVRRLEAETETV